MKISFKNTINLLLVPSLFAMVFSCKPVETGKKTKGFVLTDSMKSGMQTVVAKLQPLKNEIGFFGKITADNNKLVEVFPIVGGSVVKVYVELGDRVEKGQLLATIRSTEVAGFEKDLMDAKSDVMVAKNNLKVAQEMYDGKLVAEREVIEARGQLEKALAQLQRVQETFNIYSLKNGSVYEVRSPISGFIIQKNINQDMQLRSDRTDNIFDVADINDVWAIANVNESDIGEIQEGMDAAVSTISYNDKTFHGKVDKIFNVIDPETHAMKVMIRLKNDGFLLKPEMRATIKISYTENGNMLAVPASAVIFDKSRYYVMVYQSDTHVETRPVELFRETAGLCYIKSGLAEGDKVVTKNQLLLYDELND